MFSWNYQEHSYNEATFILYMFMDPILISIFIILIILSMFFSASETAFSSIAQHKVDTLLKQKKTWAKALKTVKAEPDKLLMSILIGNNIVNIAAATLATTISIGIAKLIGYNEATVIGISTGVVTILILIFGEIAPKTFAIRHSEKIGLSIAPFYVWFTKLLTPIIRLLTRITKKLNKGWLQTEISQEEIEAFIELSNEAWAFEETEYKQIKKMLNFNDITVEEAMTPRIKINAIPDSITVDQAIDHLLTLHHTRIPVYHEHIDDTEKVITLRELINFKHENNGDIILRKLPLNPITKIPSPTPIDAALNAFKKSRKHVALVMDKYGGVAGLITLEDIIEEIFGDIQDENDIETAAIRIIDDHTWKMQSFVRIDELLHETNLNYDELGINEEEYDGETLSYLITSILERFPKEGEKISFKIEKFWLNKEENPEKQLEIKILQITGNTIGDLQISIN